MLPDEEQRATHNLLLEYIAEIKGVYYKYRGRHANPSAHAAACMLKRDHEDMSRRAAKAKAERSCGR